MPRKDPEARRAYQKEYSARNKELAYARVKEWRAANPEKWAEQQKRYAEKHPEKITAKTIRWRDKDPEHAAKLAKECRLRNKARVTANKSKYRATKANRTPSWLTEFDLFKIKCIYSVASMLTKVNNEPWHVDHILPLKGKLVSGLHVPSNLQVMRGVDNMRKNNRVKYA